MSNIGRARAAGLILLASFAFTMTVTCVEPRFHSCRIFLFPGLAIVLGLFHAFGANLAGRALLVWNLTTALNTFIYGGVLFIVMRMLRRFSVRPEQP